MNAPKKRANETGGDGRAWVRNGLPLGLALLYFGVLAAEPTLTTRWLDFPVYWEAGEKAIVGRTVYDVVGHFQYKYSPLVALLFGKLFAGVPFEMASVIFQKSMLAIWAALFAFFARRNAWIAPLALLYFGNALRLDLALGQVNALVLVLLAVLFAALGRKRTVGRDLAFGAVFSLAVQLKLFSLVLVPLLVLRGEWRKLAVGLAALPVFSVGGVALAHGWDFAVAENGAWFASLGESTDELLLSAQNVGALGTFGKLFDLGFAKAVWLASGAAFGAFLWRNRDRGTDWFREWLLYAVALFNPLVWSYWILYALPLFASRAPDFAAAFRRRSLGERIVGAGAALFALAAFNGQHAKWAWNGGIFAGLVLLGFAASRVRGAGRAA